MWMFSVMDPQWRRYCVINHVAKCYNVVAISTFCVFSEFPTFRCEIFPKKSLIIDLSTSGYRYDAFSGN